MSDAQPHACSVPAAALSCCAMSTTRAAGSGATAGRAPIDRAPEHQDAHMGPSLKSLLVTLEADSRRQLSVPRELLLAAWARFVVGSAGLTELDRKHRQRWSVFLRAAAEGNRYAAGLLLANLDEAVLAFNQLAQNKPELFREFARSSMSIPIAISHHPQLRKKALSLLKTLTVGKELPKVLQPRQGRPAKSFDNATRLASALLKYILTVKQAAAYAKATSAGTPAQRGLDVGPWVAVVVNLPDFSSRTWRRWAEAGWEYVESVSPKNRPELDDFFYNPTTSICKMRSKRRNPYGSEDVECPSIPRQDIKDALFDGFKAVARFGKPRAESPHRALLTNVIIDLDRR